VHSRLGRSGWITADEFYGQNWTFWDWLAAQGVPFVLTTRSPSTTDGWLNRPASSRGGVGPHGSHLG